MNQIDCIQANAQMNLFSTEKEKRKRNFQPNYSSTETFTEFYSARPESIRRIKNG